MVLFIIFSYTSKTQQMSNSNLTTLSAIVDALGVTYPAQLPDIQVSDAQYESESLSTQKISATISLTDLAGISQAFGLLDDVFPDQPSVRMEVEAGTSGRFGLLLIFDDLKITLPGNSGRFPINQPTLSIDFNPANMNFMVKLMGDTSINVLGTNIQAKVSGVVNEKEINLGLDVTSGNSYLFTPPELKGFHVTEIGGEVGMFFEPPGVDFGFTGQCYIGNQGSVPLDDDRFGLVLNIQGETVEVMYLSFYMAQLDVNQMMEIFTNTNARIDTNVSLSQLEFFYAPSSVVLPNGDMSKSGISARGAVDILDFGFYGLFYLNGLDHLNAEFECNPIDIKTGDGSSILYITGNGQGVSRKVDWNGNPVKYNLVVNDIDNTKPLEDVFSNTTDQQIVKQDGPILQVQTSSSPYLNVSFNASLLDLFGGDLNASLDDNGIMFDFESSAMGISSRIFVTLKNRNEFIANFMFNFNNNFSINISDALGWIADDFTAEAYLEAEYKNGQAKITCSASLNRSGEDFSVGPFELDAYLTTYVSLVAKIAEEAGKIGLELFKDIANDAKKWTEMVVNVVIEGAGEIPNVLQDQFNKSGKEAAKIMKEAKVAIDDVAGGLKDVYNLGSYSAADSMKYAGYGAKEVGKTFKKIGYPVKDVANALGKVYNMSGDALKKTLGAVGYSADKIKDLGEDLGSDIKDTLGF